MVSGQLKSIQRLLVMKTSKVFGIVVINGGWREDEIISRIVPIKMHCFKDFESAKNAAQHLSSTNTKIVYEIDLILYDNLAEALV